MRHIAKFQKIMLAASALSWVLVTLMPVINAHGSSAGVWATLCTINGFVLVQVEEGSSTTQHSKPCPFSHFSTFHQDSLPTPLYLTNHRLAKVHAYAYLALSLRYELAVPRAPPHTANS
ncbi:MULTISPECIES: hypothetical protein [Vibrio]|uniref:Uncharacterized protein n=1 Tax=Photobacterium sp. (strain ATCC 43367) TaxID=379097 RepID=A0A0A5I3C0_PHOS4|nr:MULTISPECIES: hypothetical protein [Vibrio]EED26154.1 conserved hypothetical protein [Vibrio sp. 16]KGY10331.1 hypothetical protein NM06_05330 [Vibrio sinaloensis]KHT47623.1 hypothetical protein RJ47_01995 [Vibrio sinaloensis]CAK4075599.1 hypothetical protein VDT1_4095 [Vibrio sp. 16]